jgi:hypothetical protein
MLILQIVAIPQNDDRHTFYQHSAPLSEITTTTHLLYTSAPDREGFCRGREGTHTIPFAMKLPTSDGKSPGAKGSLQLRNGASVRYISMALSESRMVELVHGQSHISIETSKYGHRTIPPASSPQLRAPSTALPPSPFSWAVPGKLKLTASLHREIWIAGQRCYVKVFVANDTTKKVKNVTLSLIRVDTIFRLNPAWMLLHQPPNLQDSMLTLVRPRLQGRSWPKPCWTWLAKVPAGMPPPRVGGLELRLVVPWNLFTIYYFPVSIQYRACLRLLMTLCSSPTLSP